MDFQASLAPPSTGQSSFFSLIAINHICQKAYSPAECPGSFRFQGLPLALQVVIAV